MFVGEALGHEPVEAEPGSPGMRGAMAMRSPRPHSSAPTLQEIERGLSLPPAVINSTGPPKKTRPKRRGVEMSTSLLLVSQPCACMMAGRSVAQDER